MKGCPRCGRMFEGDFSKCPYCNFDFSEIMLKNNVITESEPKYAGFIKRLIAFNLDNILIEIIVSIIYLILSIPYGVILLNIVIKLGKNSSILFNEKLSETACDL